MTLIERARRYVDAMPPSVSGSGGHNAAFAAACALVKGFGLSAAEARPLMEEFNRRCSPPWSPRELEHKLRSAEAAPDTEARGYLVGDHKAERGSSGDVPASGPAPVPPARVEYDEAALVKVAGEMAGSVDLLWMANRSERDPATMSATDFLRYVYAPGEKVVVFDNQRTQGVIWPGAEIPTKGPDGVWFLAQPVDGLEYPNPRMGGKASRRSEESVTAWRYVLLESDKAPASLWLAALAQLPLRIEAVYSSGGRSVHALLRVDARSKAEWEMAKRQLGPALVLLGADPGALSCVRLTRLPGCLRQKTGRPQKLLYVRRRPPVGRLADLPACRDVERDWCRAAEAGPAEGEGAEWMMARLEYYAPRSARCAEAAERLRAESTV